MNRPHSCTIQTSDALWDELRAAGEAEHDRFWRMPIDEEYGPQIYSSNADLQNVNRSHSDFLAFRHINSCFMVDWW